MFPLWCIINQQCRIVVGCRSLVVNSRMTAFIFPYRLSSLADAGILGKVCFLVFETAKLSLNFDAEDLNICHISFIIPFNTDLMHFKKLFLKVRRISIYDDSIDCHLTKIGSHVCGS